MAVIPGCGPDSQTLIDSNTGAKQSKIPYRFDLLPPLALASVAQVLERGALKYGDDNWLPIPVRQHLNHAIMHVLAWMAEDEQEDHLAHAATRILMALEREAIDIQLLRVEYGEPK